MNCIIVEDEPAAQSILQHNIARCPDLKCCGTFADAFSAQAYLALNTIDLIFLDINLPEMSGVSFLRSLIHPPLVIFTTAYSQYAVDGFDLEAVDFLLKPFSFERFCKAVNKAREKFKPAIQAVLSPTLSVKTGKRIYPLEINDIRFIESTGDYVSIYSTTKKLIVHGTLKSWEEKLKGSAFMKIHRTLLVNVLKIDHIEGNLIQIGDRKLPVAEQYKEQLIERMLGKMDV